MLFLTIAIAVVIGLAILFFFLGLSRVANKTQQDEKFSQMIEAITRSEIEIERMEADMPKGWVGYWYRLALDAGYKPENKSGPSYIALIAPIVLFAIGFLVWPRDVIAGIAFAAAALVALRLIFRTMATRRIRTLDKQLPNLLSGLRASLQANLTPQQAILQQAEEFKAPLGDELRILRNELSVNIPLDTALNNLAYRIPSREVKFLVAAMRIAISSGSDLDSLIATIQNIVVQRQRIADRLASAVAEVQPAILVSGIMIPAALAFSYFSSASNKAFWDSGFGLIGVIIVAILYAAGLFISKKQVDRVKDA
jgi:Flp pilus assembly protein TadB